MGIAIGLVSYHTLAPNKAEGQNELLYPNDGIAVIMNGRDYDAFTLAYCLVVHGEQHTRAAKCIMDVRREFPARKLGYATEAVEPRRSDVPG